MDKLGTLILGEVVVKILCSAIAGLLMLSAAAQAADLPAGPVETAVAVPSFSWTGGYVGVFGAYHDGKIKDRGCVGLCRDGVKVKEPYLGVQAGYDYQFDNNFVVGAFAWVGVTRVKESVNIGAGVTVKGRTDFAGMVGARVGYAFDRFLPYAFVGYEYVHGRVRIAVAPQPTEKKSHDGVGLGLGLEYAFTDHVSIDARYMYSRLGRESYNFGGGTTRAGERASTFSLGVNYRF